MEMNKMTTRQYKNYERIYKIDPANLNFAWGNKKVHIVVDIVESAQRFKGWKEDDGTWGAEPSVEWSATARTACRKYGNYNGRMPFDSYNGDAERDAKMWNTHPEQRCAHCVAMLSTIIN
tara:strand:- start:1235 stop:1594 length:360 start_codon:yes stop_codon:yes gene_type:complete